MPTFQYKVRDDLGKPRSGTSVSASAEALADTLTHSGYTIISITQVNTVNMLDNFLKGLTRIKNDEMVMYTVQLSSMLNSGLSLPASLHIFMEQLENKRLRDATSDIYDEIKGGSSFSEALKKHPDIFSSLFISMVAAGEVSGNMDDVLKRLATAAEKEAELKQKVGAALFYPMILVILGSVIITAIVVTVLPAFVKIFKDSGVTLPLPTQILYNTNLFIRGYWHMVFGALIGIFILFNYVKRTPWGKASLDRIIFATPVLGDISRKSTIARFARTLSALISSGVSMLEALQTVERTVDNAVLSKVIRKVYEAVSKGESLSKPLKDSREFPPMPIQMIAVGEETGNLDGMLNKVADFYELLTDYAVRKLSSLLEPIFLIIIGGMVAFIYASILLPIFRMVGTLRH